MGKPEVVIIDYGMGNLFSAQRSLEFVGARAIITSNADRIRSAQRVVLPGVGAFPNAIDELRRRGLLPVIKEIAHLGTPMMGICLGMQLLFETSTEFGTTKGLGLIPGHVMRIPAQGINGNPLKIPHIGWSALEPFKGTRWKSTILSDIEIGESTYFVHSFMVCSDDKRHRIADCDYGGIKIPSVVANKNILGCQFHPEKSGEVGLRILKNFLCYKNTHELQAETSIRFATRL